MIIQADHISMRYVMATDRGQSLKEFVEKSTTNTSLPWMT